MGRRPAEGLELVVAKSFKVSQGLASPALQTSIWIERASCDCERTRGGRSLPRSSMCLATKTHKRVRPASPSHKVPSLHQRFRVDADAAGRGWRKGQLSMITCMRTRDPQHSGPRPRRARVWRLPVRARVQQSQHRQASEYEVCTDAEVLLRAWAKQQQFSLG